MRFDIRNYFKTGKTPYTAQFSEDFSTENFDGSVIREPVTGSFQAVPTADGVVMQLTIAAETGAVALLTVTPEGGKPMAGTAWAAGRRLKAGDSL